jgi:hypothetical protein
VFDGEEYIGGVWDDSLNMCLGGTVVNKNNGQCFGGNELSNWNNIENQQTSSATFSIINQPGNCSGEYISERDCCILNPIVSYCSGNGNTEQECCESNAITSYCSNDDPDNPTFSEQYCCEQNGGTWLEGECSGEPSEIWIQTYWNDVDGICVNGSDAWINTNWDYGNDICVNAINNIPIGLNPNLTWFTRALPF